MSIYVSVKSTGCVVKGGRQPLACCLRFHADYFRAAQWSVNTNPVARDGRSMRRLRTKRQFGAAVRWLGLDFFLSLGVVVVPENKRLRALTSMLAMASGEPTTFSAYQAATSFLQYLKPFVADADGTYFYGLYEPYSRGADGQQPNPADIVTMTPAIRAQAQRWITLLRSTAGMFASSVLAPSAPSVARPLLHLYSDAALEGAAVPGLGGYMHGFYWEVALHGNELLLPISVLELIAIGINLVVFA